MKQYRIDKPGGLMRMPQWVRLSFVTQLFQRPRYCILVDSSTLRFATSRLSHFGPFFSSLVFPALGVAIVCSAIDPPDVIRRWLGIAWIVLFMIPALNQLRLMTVGETWVFDKNNGVVRRYGKVVCRFD